MLSGNKRPERPPGVLRAPDERQVRITYSGAAGYVNITERDDLPIGGFEALSVALMWAQGVLGELAKQQAMTLCAGCGVRLRPQEKGGSDDGEKI